MTVFIFEDEFSGDDCVSISNESGSITLNSDEIVVLFTQIIDTFGDRWLKDELENYLIYINS